MSYTTNASLAAEARKALDDATWAYLVGGAGTEATLRRNRIAFESIAFLPRVLRDVRSIDPSVEILGTKMRIPVLMAPIGNLDVFHSDGPAQVGAASSALGVMQVVAGVGPIPEIPTGAGPKAYQIYKDGDGAWLADRVEVATAAGYAAIVLTVDVPRRARRERQALAGYRFAGGGPSRDHLARTTWADVEILRGATNLPLLIKGVQISGDATTAVELGVDGIWVSNHGGRQLDHGRSTVESLRDVAEAVGDTATIVVDGGIMTGSDVLKAVALGADLVAIGKLQCLALAAGGSAGLSSMLEVLEEEIISQMGMMGITTLAELDASFVSTTFSSGLPDPADPWSYLR